MNAIKRPIEIAEEIVGADNWFSVVISNIEDKIQLQDVQNKIYEICEGGDGFQKTQSGNYLNKYAQVEEYNEGISLHPTHNFATQLERYNELSEEQKIIIDSIKQICNTFPCAFFWHNGNAEDKCQFIGLHIHLLLGSKHQLSQIYRYRNIVSMMKSRGVDVRSQKVRYLQALVKQLLTPPRILMGCNNIQLCSQLHRWKKEVDDIQERIPENDYEMPVEDN